MAEVWELEAMEPEKEIERLRRQLAEKQGEVERLEWLKNAERQHQETIRRLSGQIERQHKELLEWQGYTVKAEQKAKAAESTNAALTARYAAVEGALEHIKQLCAQWTPASEETAEETLAAIKGFILLAALATPATCPECERLRETLSELRQQYEQYVKKNCSLIRHSVADGLGYPDDVEGRCGGYTQCGDEPHWMCQECVAVYDPEAEYTAALGGKEGEHE